MTTNTDKIEEPIGNVVEYLEQNFDSFHAWEFTGGKRIESAKKLRSLAAELTELRKENNTLRGLLGNSAKDCQYCGLPAAEQGRCKSGFPGCSRADDQQLGEYFAAGYALQCCEEE